MDNISPSMIRDLRKKPSLFVEKIVGVDNVYPYQKDFLDNSHDRKVLVGGRQIGKTTMMAWLALHQFTMFTNQHILIVAPTKRQAKNFMTKLKTEISEWLRNEDKYGLDEVMKLQLHGKNGSMIRAVPALEETIRGLTINSAFVDEAAFISRDILTSVISPMLATTEGYFVLGSTPWGKEGYLHEKCKKDDHWDSYQISSMENPEIPARQIEEWRRDMTTTDFEREVLGHFKDKKNAFFKNKDISRCLEWAKKKDASNVLYPERKNRDCYLGVDPATQGDDSAVLTTIDIEGDVFDITAQTNCTIPELEGEIRHLINKDDRNYLSGYIEENGIGEGTVHRFEKEFPQIEGFRTTLRSKESIYQKCKNYMQEDKISIPDHQNLKSQLRSIEYEMTERGNKKIHAPENEHDDFADSFVLSVAAFSGDSFVDRQAHAYTFDNNSSVSSDVTESNKRAFTF